MPDEPKLKPEWLVVVFLEVSTYVRANSEEEAYRMCPPVDVPGYDIDDVDIEATKEEE